MSLGDPLYFLFLGLISLLYYALRPGPPRRVLLLVASYFFYFELSRFYILVLLFVTLATWLGARMLRSPRAEKRRFLLFGLILTVVLAPMLVFKYLGPLLIVTLRENFLPLAFPIGISFFTFAALGYLIDVYLEVVEPEPSLCRVALFLGFFPLVSAGPIERAGRFLSQFDLAAVFMADRVFAALRLIFIGLFLKVVLADTLSEPVDLVYASPAAFSALEQLCATIYYAFYLYADFAGYSLIAIGSALLLGLEVRPNFQQPFLSATVPEFWRNWHISLSSWVRDYLFSPLRMEWRRYHNWGFAAALLVSFIILGAWHGAKWGFVAFGLIHGLYVVTSTFTLARRDAIWAFLRVPRPLLHFVRIINTFALVVLAFVVYRADTMTDAISIYRAILSPRLLHDGALLVSDLRFHGNLHSFAVLKGFLLTSWTIPFLIAGNILARRKFALENFPLLLQVIIYNGGLLMIVSQWLTHHGSQPFVYYKF